MWRIVRIILSRTSKTHCKAKVTSSSTLNNPIQKAIYICTLEEIDVGISQIDDLFHKASHFLTYLRVFFTPPFPEIIFLPIRSHRCMKKARDSSYEFKYSDMEWLKSSTLCINTNFFQITNPPEVVYTMKLLSFRFICKLRDAHTNVEKISIYLGTRWIINREKSSWFSSI